MVIKNYNICSFVIILFPICSLIGGIGGYYDEVIGICGFCFLWYKMLLNQLHYKISVIVLFLLFLTFIGIVSNVISGICNNAFAIAVDALWLWKTFACFILASYIFKNDNILNRTINFLCKPALLTIYILALLSIAGEIINIGITSKTAILGIKAFRFFLNSSVQTGWLIIGCVIVVALSNVSDIKFKRCFIVALIPLILTMSSMVYCWIVISIILFLVLHRKSKFKIIYIVPICLAIFLFILGDLQTYFFDQTSSVRITFIRKGIEVANRYFPLGAGFATFGSEMASRVYSKLYVEFGWENSWAFSQGSGFLNDTFFASILGQFGWIGFCLYLMALYQIFCIINSAIICKRVRVVAIATFLSICAAMVGSATVKSMMGCCLFFLLGVVASKILESAHEE